MILALYKFDRLYTVSIPTKMTFCLSRRYSLQQLHVSIEQF